MFLKTTVLPIDVACSTELINADFSSQGNKVAGLDSSKPQEFRRTSMINADLSSPGH